MSISDLIKGFLTENLNKFILPGSKLNSCKYFVSSGFFYIYFFLFQCNMHFKYYKDKQFIFPRAAPADPP